MNAWTRQAGGWIATIGVIVVLAGALVLRDGLATDTASPTPSLRTDGVAAQASDTLRPSDPATPRSTGTSMPRATSMPATPTPLPATPPPAAAAQAPAPPAAPAPAPPSSTPVPVADPDPALLTEERVDGAFGQTLTIDGYSVRALRTAAPQSACIGDLTPDIQVFDVTLTYSGPLFDVGFDVAGPTWTWCVDGGGSGAPLFPSGVTRQVVVTTGEGYSTGDAPLTVYIKTVNGSHSLRFAFH